MSERETILMVDDLEMNRHMLRIAFENQYDLLEAKDGREALELLTHNHVDLVITDIYMDVMDGYELMQKIRKNRKYKDMPIIAVTESDKASRTKALHLGANDLVYRPYISEILNRRVNALLMNGIDLQKYKLAFENNPISFVLFHVIDRPDTPSYNAVYMNKVAQKKLGAVMPKGKQVANEDSQPLNFLLEVLRSGESGHISKYNTMINRHLDVTAYKDGYGLVAAMINDITEQISEIREAKELSEALINTTPGGFVRYQVKHGEVNADYVSQGMADLLGYEVETLKEQLSRDYTFGVYPEDVDLFRGRARENIDRECSFDGTVRLQHRDGHSVWVRMITQIKVEEKFQYHYASYFDITEQKKNAQIMYEKEKALIEEQEANKAKTEFLSNMSHEIRTPMNAIIGMTKLAEDVADDQRCLEIANYLRQIDDSSCYLLGVINNILDMSRIESGKFRLEKKWVMPSSIINPCIEMIKANMEQKKIHFIYNEKITMKQDFDIYTDPLKTQQMIMNILNNAWKFTDEGGEVEICFVNKEFDQEHKRAVDQIYIRDTGCGMSEEFLEKVFTPFEQENNKFSHSVKGTGLGLALAKKIAGEMGGDIAVESELGRGSTFTITFPYQYRKHEQDDKLLEKRELDLEKLKNRKILLAEDHPLNVVIAQKLLEKQGMEVSIAQNGQEAVELYRNSKENTFDAILMDIRMPVKDGLEAAKEIRALNREDARRVPIIAMTANAFDEDRKNSIDVGMNDHLAKPVEPDTMYATLAKYMDAETMLDAGEESN